MSQAEPDPAPSAAESTGGPRHDLPGEVVVGIDGSDEARAAAGWAAAEAARLRTGLVLVSAYTVPHRGLLAYDVMAPDYAAIVLAHQQETHREIAAELLTRHPGLPISSTVEAGHPVDVLLGRSAGAALLVVSTRERGRFRRAVGGSVAQALAAHATVPVAVIRPGTAAPRTGPVVVGVDGSPNSRPAIGAAYDAAATRGVELVALHAWHDDMTLDVDERGLVGADIGDEALREIERALVSEELAGWAERYPDVVVRPLVRKGDPVTLLLEASGTAGLVVVGSRGRGGFSGALLGSTGQELIMHGEAPVLVVRSAATDSG
ncbi:universal stress protein [Nakamurella sp.]|uniref:universal stress protein n=1 Tax=Nakamurella sp. TaxID=1869182 RepID=UPI003B3A8DEA